MISAISGDFYGFVRRQLFGLGWHDELIGLINQYNLNHFEKKS